MSTAQSPKLLKDLPPPFAGRSKDPMGLDDLQCPDTLCNGRAAGNYEYPRPGKQNYFLRCTEGGLAQCEGCWPEDLVFSERCNQCLYSKNGNDIFQRFLMFYNFFRN